MAQQGGFGLSAVPRSWAASRANLLRLAQSERFQPFRGCRVTGTPPDDLITSRLTCDALIGRRKSPLIWRRTGGRAAPTRPHASRQASTHAAGQPLTVKIRRTTTSTSTRRGGGEPLLKLCSEKLAAAAGEEERPALHTARLHPSISFVCYLLSSPVLPCLFTPPPPLHNVRPFVQIISQTAE